MDAVGTKNPRRLCNLFGDLQIILNGGRRADDCRWRREDRRSIIRDEHSEAGGGVGEGSAKRTQGPPGDIGGGATEANAESGEKSERQMGIGVESFAEHKKNADEPKTRRWPEMSNIF